MRGQHASRRQVLGAAGAALGLAALPSVVFAAPPAGAVSEAVHGLNTGLSRAEVARLLPQMRKARGCLAVKVLSGANGQLALWQHWQSSAAMAQFQNALKESPKRYEKLSF